MMLKAHLIRQINGCLLLAFILTTCFTAQLEGQSCLPPSVQSRLAEYKRENRFDEAMTLLNTYQDSTANRKNKKAIFESEMLKADLYRMKGQYLKSVELIDSLRLSDYAANLKNDLLIGQLYTIQGTLLLTKGELKKGLTSILKALQIYNLSVGSQDTIIGPCFNKLGNYYYFTKNYDSAIYWYSKAMITAEKKRNNLEDRASYIQNMGIIYLELNDYARAENCFLESLCLKEDLFSSNSFTLGRLYLNLGRFYQGVSALDKAIIYLSKAECIFSQEKVPATLELGSIFWNKGLIYHLSGENELALTYLFNARQIIDSVFVENKNLLASLNSDIGNVYKYTGQNEKAIFYYYKSLAGADTLLRKKTLRNLANLYHLEGDYDQAEIYFKELMEATKNTLYLENPENGLTHLQYGYYLLDRRNDSALFFLNRALSIFEKNHGFQDGDMAASLYMIGDYYLKKDELITALKYYQQSLIAISSSLDDSNLLNNPLLNSLNPDIRTFFALTKKAGCLNKCFTANHDVTYIAAAIKTYQLCFDLIDQMRMTLKAENSKIFFQNRIYDTYIKAIENCLLAYKLTGNKTWLYQAFEISERNKSMILLQELVDANAKKMALIPEELTNAVKEIRNNINLYQNKIWEEENLEVADEKKLNYLRFNQLILEKKHDSLKNQLEHNYPEYYKLKYDYSVVSVNHLQDLLDKNEVIIEYSLSDNYVYIFLVTTRNFEVKTVPVDKTLINEIFALRDNLDFRHVLQYNFKDYMEYQIIAYQLYSKLIQPVENYLENKKVIIIPDEELSYLSFESLIQKITPSDTIAFRNLPYLIKRCSVSYAPSSTIYALIKKGKTPTLNTGVLALAPSADMLTRSMLANNKALAEVLKYDFDLPGATHEAESILKVMKGLKLIGEEATESAFKKLASNYDILHFATHTRIDDENPLSSVLSFYPYGDKGEDGMLHTYEIYNLALNGELAVLSTCSSGNGKLAKGEGVISLARAFTYAGMPSVIMTLWNVEDISTGNILPFFYYLLGKGSDKDVALRQAKLNYLEVTKPEIETHPAFWSGFVLYGNNRGFRQKADYTLIILLLLLGILIILISFVIIRRYIHFRKKLNGVAIDLPKEFRPEDGL